MNSSMLFLRRARRLWMFLFLFSLTLVPCLSQAQGSVPYNILVNDPDIVPTSYLDFYYFDYEGGLSNPDEWQQNIPGLSASLVFEHKPLGRIGVQGKASVCYYGEKREAVKLPFHVEGGPVISLKSKIKEQDIKVQLRTFTYKADVVTDKGKWLGTVDAIGEDYIMVTAKKEHRYWLRGGALLRRSTYYPRSSESNVIGSQFVGGIYGGIEWTRRAHVLTELTDKKAVSAEYIKGYADLMVFPLALYNTPARNKRSPIGFRLGITGKLPGMRHFFNYMMPKVEIGMMPLDGLYWSVGFGMNLYKS